MVLFLFCHVVITLFAFSTCQCDFYAHDFHLHCVFALSLVILADQRRSLHFCPVFAARTSAISGIKKRPSSMSLVYCSTGTACCQQNSPKYAEIFYQDRIVHRCPASCNIRSPHGEFCFAKDRTVRRAVTPCLFEAVPDRKWFCAQEKLRTEPFYVLSESFPEKALRIRSGIRVFHLVAEFKEYLVQCCTRLFFQHFSDFVVCFFSQLCLFCFVCLPCK